VADVFLKTSTTAGKETRKCKQLQKKTPCICASLEGIHALMLLRHDSNTHYTKGSHEFEYTVKKVILGEQNLSFL